jgi:putative ABC transport system permease protein
MLAQLAWRNVLRSPRRSAITVASIALGLAALTFVWAFIDGMNRQMIENSTRFLAGDLQVHLKGYQDDPTLDLAMPEIAPVVQAARSDPAVAATSVRLEGKALASRGDKSRGIAVVGVQPRQEAAVTSLLSAVTAGRSLREDDTGALIGEQLAQTLGLRAGDELLLVGQAYDGSVASGHYPVRGVFRTGIEEIDGHVAVLPLAVVREFLAAPAGATAVALRLADRGALDAARQRLSAGLGPRFEVLAWPTLLPMVATMKVAVATSERGDNRDKPHTPWPLVQPDP